VEKCIYLDCDVIALDDIAKLWTLKLQGRPLGGVGDRAGLQTKRHIYNKKQPMFNSGVMLLDLALWRQEGYVDKLAAFWNENRSWMNFADQGLLNAFFDGNYTMLPQRWNIINSVYRNPPVESMYDAEEVKESIRHPGIVHFTGHHKPWRFWKSFHHPYGYTFCLCALKSPVNFWFKTKLWLKLRLRRRFVDSPKKRDWGKQDIQTLSFD
jgi:UDP-glucose/galactose:(glucosyl)LPS alpha-1,2-glucosyl/galactosyltransferase